MRDRPRAIVVLIAVFLLGCLAGSTGSYFWLKKSSEPDRGVQEYRESPGKNGRMPRPEPPNFRQMLQLTPEQYEQFQKIIGDYRKTVGNIRKQTDDFHFEQDKQIKAVLAEMNGKLTAVLNEEQKTKFDAWQKEFEKTRRRPPRGREGPPPPE